MKTIHYADYDIMTTDSIAAAILEYSRVLAHSERSDSVHIPGVNADGELVGYDLLVGPASQIVVADSATGDPGIDDHDALAELRERTAALASGQVDTASGMPVEHDYDNDYLGIED